MSAVMKQEAVLSPELRLEGRGHDLLETWAPWARDDAHGEGEAVGYFKDRIDRAYWGDPPPEYWIVDKIVAPHRRDRTNYWTVVARWYLGEKTLSQISKELGFHWPPRRVLLNLVAFGALVEREYVDFLDAMKARRVRCSGRVYVAPAR